MLLRISFCDLGATDDMVFRKLVEERLDDLIGFPAIWRDEFGFVR